MIAAALAASIFAGTPVDAPYLASLTRAGPVCGGALIAPESESASGSVDDIAVILLRSPVRDVTPLPQATAPDNRL